MLSRGTSMYDFDAIIIGVGGMGSAALFHLAQRGVRVLGIEQFGVGHERGSSHGETRIIRRAYFEHPSYVPLLNSAYELWAELARVAGRKLFHRTGMLVAGPGDGPVVTGVLRSAELHRLDVQPLSAAQAADRFPGFRLPGNCAGLFEADAGILLVEDCVRAYVDAARAAGARLLENTPVLGWSGGDRQVVVRTANAEYTARSLVITGGAWAGRLLQSLHLPLEVRRKVVFWYEGDDGCFAKECGCPVFGFETAAGFFYGIPALDGGGVKVAHHSGGRVVHDPAVVDRALHPEDEAPVRAFVADYLPRLRSSPPRYSVCLYTMTSDENFIIDRHPQHDHVVFAAGFSGHGFKFASVVGSVLADLAVDGATEEPIDFLNLSRLRRPLRG